ncbi:MAG: glycosyltransferase family 39 protein [Candidatus Krumholzibacteriota bacterium]|nr:glycosyltransferase family 39 protein [Candidatus Krumholzibacteriota bacterium]
MTRFRQITGGRGEIAAALLIFIVLAAGLRLWNCTAASLNNDELSTWYRSDFSSPIDVVREGVVPDVHPPGYQILMWAVERTAGESALALRLPSVLFGILSTVAIFFLGRSLFSWREGLYAAAMIATLWCPVTYSRIARAYSLLLLLSILSTLFWTGMIRGLRTTATLPRRDGILYFAAAIAACYTHYFGLLLVALQGVLAFALLATDRRALLRAAGLYAAVLLVFVPWLPAMREQLARGPIWIRRPQFSPWYHLLHVWRFFFDDSRIMGRIALAAAPALALAALGVAVARRSWRVLGRAAVSREAGLVLWAVAPFAAAFILSRVSSPILTNRNMIISLPAAILLVARALALVPLPRGAHAAAAVLLAALLTDQLVYSTRLYSRPSGEQFREAAEYASSRILDAERTLFVTVAHQKEYFDYYLRGLRRGRVADINFRHPRDWGEVKALLEEREHDNILLLSGGINDRQHRQMIENAGYVRTDRRQFRRACCSLYEKGSPAAGRRRAGGSGGHPAPARAAETPEALWDRAQGLRDPARRIETWRKIVTLHPRHRYAPQALLMIGFACVEEIGDTVAARDAYRELIASYPHSASAGSARFLLDELDGKAPVALPGD